MTKVKHAHQIKKKKAPAQPVIQEVLKIMNEMKIALEQTKEPDGYFNWRDKVNNWYSRLLLKDPIKCIKGEVVKPKPKQLKKGKSTTKKK